MVGGCISAWCARVLERGEFVLLENVVGITIRATGRLSIGSSLVVEHGVDVLGVNCKPQVRYDTIHRGIRPTVIVVAVVLELNWSADPVVPHRLIRVENDGVTLADEDIETIDNFGDVVDTVDLTKISWIRIPENG